MSLGAGQHPAFEITSQQIASNLVSCLFIKLSKKVKLKLRIVVGWVGLGGTGLAPGPWITDDSCRTRRSPGRSSEAPSAGRSAAAGTPGERTL